MRPWYELENPQEVDSPALLVNPQLVQHNIQVALGMVASADLLRPHVKTNKIAEVSAMMLEAGIRKFKCATIAEAEMLARLQAPDILLAYQPGPAKVSRLAALVEAFPASRFSCLVDNAGTLALLAQTFAGRSFEVFIDLNVGMNRTGIRPHLAFDLFEASRAFSNIRVKGLHAYDGHIHANSFEERKQQAALVLAQTRKLKQQIETAYGNNLTLVMGGSPTFGFYCRQPGVEASPGTFVFWDEGYHQMMPEVDFVPAAVLMTRIISVVDEEKLCLDLGHKSVAAENPQPRARFLHGSPVMPVSQSEEHLVVRLPQTAGHQVGQAWYAVPWHICPTVALYDAVHLVENHRFSRKWKVVARDRALQF